MDLNYASFKQLFVRYSIKSFKISNWVFIKLNFGRLIKQIYSEWLDLKNDLFPVGLVQVPRHVIVAQSEIIEIHRIADASEKAYACVCVYSFR